MKKTIAYLKWLELQNYKIRSIETLISLVKQVEEYLKRAGLNWTSEGLKSFANWAANQGYSLIYQKHLHWGIRSYCSYLKQVHHQEIRVYLPKLKNYYNRRIALDKNQLEIIVDWLEKTKQDYWLNQTLWSLFYGCGIRRAEALNLEINNLKVQAKLLEVRTVKSGGTRSLPLSKNQLKALVNYIELERPKAKQGYENKLLLGKRGGSAKSMLGKQLTKWQAGTGLEMELCWHVLRHSIASELVAKGMKIEQVSLFLGHNSIESTSRYLHYNPTKNEL
ncbi:tyrosine-type recombinase/integrase [Aureispira sp. CCB-QB1]|uniref:tyrosine-type recombinase/integrase n=1 Tax=Aureispira sp. CCB-QB1 TaxID=1313421 RepID=UPI000697E2CE|nr:tyrosine-type recombinase/integrase [Aureispira sp. CCB-QB1]